MLQRDRYPELPLTDLVEQIQARQKAKTKLSDWSLNRDLILPASLAMEQCSSQTTARYKASLVSGASLVDLTGGAGVDAFYMSSSFAHTTYVEPDRDLCQLASHNFSVLKADSIQVVNQDAETFLSNMAQPVDVIYLDPSRRQELKKVYRLSECQPNVLSFLPQLLAKANTVLLKTAPWLDIEATLKDLGKVKAVVVVAVANECKEVLYVLQATEPEPVAITAVNFPKNDGLQEFTFTREAERETAARWGAPAQWLYEPNAALLKAGAFKWIADNFGLHKLSQHSHLYTSSALVDDFPGRVFKIEKVIPYRKKELGKALPGSQANLTVRNFPQSVTQIRKKMGLKEGGDQYLFATRDLEGKSIFIITTKLDF